MTEKNVATYDQSEAVAEKEPTVFQNFIYDNKENGGVLNKFTEIDSKITEVKGFINELSGNYKTMVEKYDAFTNLSEQMDAIISTMNSRADNVAKYFNNIITTAEQAVEEHAKTDKNLMDDLDVLQGMLATGVGTEAGFKNQASAEAAFRASHNGYSQEEYNALNDIYKEQVAKEAAKHEDKIGAYKEDFSGTNYDNMNKGDLEAIADDIIRNGNYGNGTDRYAELEAQGYDAKAVQDIVNKKMNGTYESGASDFAKYEQIDGAKSAEAAQKIHDAQARGRARTEAAKAAAAGGSTGTIIEKEADPVSATSAANTRGMEKENTASEASYAKAHDYVNDAQAARQAEIDRAAANQQEANKASQEQKAKDISPGYSTAVPQTARMNEGSSVTQEEIDAVSAEIQRKSEENQAVKSQKDNVDTAAAYQAELDALNNAVGTGGGANTAKLTDR
ncbi:MAG: hypothetical protein K6C11_02525 [Bacilli bacterium]|nr:hypothetical protein [Bacilli bacterium]